MLPITYYNKRHASVSYDPKIKAPKVIWKDFTSIDDYKETLEATFEVIKKHQCTQWISDQKETKIVPKEASQWLKTVFIPKAAKAGVKKVALILSKDIFSQLYAKRLEQNIKTLGLTIKYFNYYQNETAHRWVSDLHTFKNTQKFL